MRGTFLGAGGDAAYQDALRSGDACYVGYLDAQFEYLLAFHLFLTKISTDLVYGFNPPPEDGYCNGENPPPVTGDQTVDETLAYVQRGIVDGFVFFEGECTGEGHGMLLPGSVAVDTDLLEPLQNQDNLQGESSASLGTPGSGYNSLPFLMTPHFFLYGQPHPDTKADNRTFFTAAELRTDTAGLAFPTSNPCGERTKVCELLSPQDVLNYDDKGGNLGDDITSGEHNGEFDGAQVQYTFVNPKVPTPSHELWCLRPNVLASGDASKVPGGFSDPGLYGTYFADAIDTDALAIPLRNQYRAVLGATHGPVRDGVVPAPTDEVAGVPVDEDGNGQIGLHDVESIYFFVNDGNATEDVTLPAELGELQDRADYTEGQDDDPDRTTLADPITDEERFSRTLEKGLQCDFNGLISVQSSDAELQGGLQFLMGVFQNTLTLKDPTVLSAFGDADIPLPAEASSTERNGWQVDLYDFGGSITARTDTNENGELDGCAAATGQLQPNADLCGWRAIWDAYNDDCTNIQGDECGDILDGFGYDLDAGVGLYFVVQTDGPTLINDEGASSSEIQNLEAIRVIGNETLFETNCIVGISKGFKAPLMNAHNLDVADDEALLDALCGTAGGDRIILEDAFADESGVSPGGFASDYEFGKLAPTPDGADGVTGWEGFQVCVTGIWNVADDPDTPDPEIAGDTVGNIELTGHNAFGDCDTFDDA